MAPASTGVGLGAALGPAAGREGRLWVCRESMEMGGGPRDP